MLLRCPAIVDTIRYRSEETAGRLLEEYDENAEDEDAPGQGEEYKMAVYRAGRKEKTMLYLVDEEAVRTGLVKLLWLDIHGRCVWENKIDHSDLFDFRGRTMDGGSLKNLVAEMNDEEDCEYGSELMG